LENVKGGGMIVKETGEARGKKNKRRGVGVEEA
jgi:hypothetical protein